MGLKDVLKAKTRETKSSNYASRLRKQGLMPAIFYGSKTKESMAISLEYKNFRQAYLDEKSNNNLYTLEFDNETSAVLLKDVQIDPLTRTIRHVDFFKIELDQKLKVSVPVMLTGKPIGVDKGGVLHQNMLDVEIEGIPEKIPAVLHIDVSALEFGQVLTSSEVKLEEGLELICEFDLAIASVVVPKGLEDEETEEAEEGDETLAEGEEAAASEEAPKEG